MRVVKGSADAAIIIRSDYDRLNSFVRKKLTIIHQQSLLVPGAIYLVAPTVEDHEQERIRQALLAFESTEKGKVFLKRNYINGRFEEFNSNDWLPIRMYSDKLQPLFQPKL